MPPDPIREDPYANKAVMPALVMVIAVILQYVTSEGFSLQQEGVTVLAGAISTLLVYAVSNWKKVL